jgi:hypothetical protein
MVQEDDVTLLPSNVSTDHENDLIKGMLTYDLGQINLIPNQYGTFSDLIFYKAGEGIIMVGT